MEQRSVLTRTVQGEEQGTSNRYQWMRHFFTEDESVEHRPIVELQRRAIWIGLALLLLTLNEFGYGLLRFLYELDSTWYIAVLRAFGSLILIILVLGSFVAIWMAFHSTRAAIKALPYLSPRRGTSPPHPRSYKERVLHLLNSSRWQRVMVILLLILAIGGAVEVGRVVVMSFLPPQLSNDGNSLDVNAASLLLQGRDPYTDSNILDLVRRFPIQANWTTPLRQGQFANRLDYPTISEFQKVLSSDLKTDQAPEFESKVSYPALSFLTLAPFAWLNDYNILPLYLLCHLLLIAIAWKLARSQLRPWILLFGLASVFMWTPTFGDTLDMLYTLLIIIAWLLRDQRWSSSLLLGSALASKQIAWFFLPFYVIMCWRHYGPVEALRRLVIAGCIGLIINLPFIIWNPHAWIAGVLAPLVDPMFPLGVGIIDLSINHLLPFFPIWVYTVLEGAALLLSLVWYWRLSKEHPESAMLLAVVPFFFAWRSLPSYFYGAAYGVFILMAARRPRGETHVSQEILAESRI